ncbi:MAG: hypothetical protein J7L39_02560 [Candidatus Aenigmarchaeota archaeon]|nr:hypothetical protein [Candidatus Aenigmarchaeota archaeon]
MHQPLVWKKDRLIGNLEKMLKSTNSRERWDAKLMLRAYKNPAKYVKILRESGLSSKIVLDFSGILLENLSKLEEKRILDKIEVYGEKIGEILGLYREVLEKYPDSIEFAGTAYSHCYFPSIPIRDWKLQIKEWRNVFSKIFGKKELKKVRGFWLPEMGVPGTKEKLEKLIEVVSKYYEWLILPLQSVKNYERLNYKERIEIFTKPHLLEVRKQKIKVVFRSPTYFIDQQAGTSPEFIKERIENEIEPLKGLRIIITASDGENGNVMMNEFFPKTFKPLFEKVIGKKRIDSLLVSEFLDLFCKTNELKVIELKTFGASWINGHELWKGESRKERIRMKIRMISEFYRKFKGEEKIKEKLKKLLLISQTSCYIYWGTDYWYSQAERTIEEFMKIFKKQFS